MVYTKEAFRADCLSVFRMTDGNDVAVPDVGSITVFDAPLIGFAAADDALFERYRKPEIIGSNYLSPVQWLPSAKTVVAFFLPFSEIVRASNRADEAEPSPEWLYARVEGQEFITRFAIGLQELLRARGVAACVPSLDKRFGLRFEPTAAGDAFDFIANSSWSERHAAYACGLGTFGLSKGLITEKGMAGRYASIIVSEQWEAAERPYSGIYDYCINCGACERNCPIRAITCEHGKNNALCNAYIEKMKARHAPRYGCGKCQVGVPCEFTAPGKRRA